MSLTLASACAAELPAALADYAERCHRVTDAPIPPYPGDPHDGFKHVYVCDVDPGELVGADGAPRLPYPTGTVVVKDSVRAHQDHVWLVATARRSEDGWAWREYTRNFANEPLREIAAPESVCVDCHRDARDTDWIFTPLRR